MTRSRFPSALLLSLPLMSVSIAALAQAPVNLKVDREVDASQAIEDAHPDQRFRRLGYEAAQAGRTEEARRYYRKASRYGDKISQAALAELMWTGQGGDTDRAMAYAWMDLAAERRTPYLLAKRERYWSELSEAERQRAVKEGVAVYQEYGDAVAKPRLERILRNERNKVTGSRLGFIGTLETNLVESDGTGSRVLAHQYYQDRNWKPEEYWKTQDRLLERSGSVDVGAAQKVIAPAPALEPEREH